MQEHIYNIMVETIERLCEYPKGILAADESLGTIGKRFGTISLENTHQNRYNYRKLLFTTPNLEKYISGVITYEETLLDKDDSGELLIQPLLDKKIVVGIKTDRGLVDRPNGYGEKITQGLDGLRERCMNYFNAGARFAKWRCVYEIDPERASPSNIVIEKNAATLAQYAAISQECGLIPIVEPEVLMNSVTNIRVSEHMTREILSSVFRELIKHNVILDLILLKPNMVRSNKDSGYTPEEIDDIAIRTIKVLQDTVPVSVPGIMFLSGGMSETDATLALKKINEFDLYKPWRLSFSYGRALQRSAIKTWNGKGDNIEKAQQVLLDRAKVNSEASSAETIEIV